MNYYGAQVTLEKLLHYLMEKKEPIEINQLITDDFEIFTTQCSEKITSIDGLRKVFFSGKALQKEPFHIIKLDFSENHLSDEIVAFTGVVTVHNSINNTLPKYQVSSICIRKNNVWLVHNMHISITNQDYLNNVTLAETENKLSEIKSIMENVPGGVHKCRLSSPTEVVYVSDGLCSMVGYTRRELTELFQNKYSRLVYEDDRNTFIDAIKNLTDYPHTVSINYRLQKKNGELVNVRDIIRSVRREDGNMWAYAVVIAVENNNEEKLWLKQLVKAIPDSIGIFSYWNNKVSMEFCNDEFRSFLGYTAENTGILFKTDPLNWVLTEDRIILHNSLKQLEKGKNNISCNIRIFNGEETRKVELEASVLHRGNKGIRIGAVIVQENDDMLEESSALEIEPHNKKKIFIRTFGYFDVFVDGKPIAFQYANSKELLAILVDRKGGFVSASEIISILWENDPINKTTQSRCRKTVLRLVNELKKYGISDIIESSKNGLRRIIPEKINCDLYNYLSGKTYGNNMFTGLYMTNYSWPEDTLASLWHKSDFYNT